jgi:hypothetical protein
MLESIDMIGGSKMRRKTALYLGLGIVTQVALLCLNGQAQAPAEKGRYSAMAPLAEYLISDQDAEIALARSAAPPAISGAAEVLVLGRDGYKTAVKGSNGFLCYVERAWAKPTDDPEFWNPSVRAPNCYNAQAAETFVPIYLMKTRLVLAGKSKAEILTSITKALDTKELPSLAPGAMCYMMSKSQYLSDQDSHWHPHLMFFAPGDAVKSWGANLKGSPIIAGEDPEQRVTVFMIVVGSWSDGTAAAPHPLA